MAAAVKPRLLHSRHLYSACLLLLISLLLLHRYPYSNPLDHLHNSRILSSLRPSNDTLTTPEWKFPKPLREFVPYERGSEEANLLRNHQWTRPKILFTYARPLHTNESFTQLFVYATGVQMGKYERNVTVAGCLIGTEVFNVVAAPGDVYICTVYRGVEIGEHVSLVLLRDEVLERALTGMTLGGFDVTLRKGDIQNLAPDVKLRIPKPRKAGDYAVLTGGSSVTYVAPRMETIRNRPRYKVCMGTQMKTFPHLLDDWVRYHRKLGVDQVYILDNDAEEALEGYIPQDVAGVEVVYWPFQKSQIQAMSFLLVAAREACEWILLSDADEYVLLGIDNEANPGDLREYLDGVGGDFEQHYLPYVTMGISGHVKQPEGPVAEEYTYKHTRQKRNGKTFARTDVPWLSSKIHVCWWQGGKGVDRYEVVNDKPGAGEQGVLVHFQKRSFEEMMMKRKVGSGSLGDGQIGSGENKNVTFVVSKEYREVDERLRYTYFRDVWRIVELRDEVTCLVRGDERRIIEQ